MHIKKITRQSRRDFYAIYECEHCHYLTGEEEGYDDSYFHQQVIPNMKCDKCGKKASNNYKPRATKYPDGVTV